MDDIDDLMRLATVMGLNGGVLRARDHPQSRGAFAELVRSGAIVRVLPGTFVDERLRASRLTRCAAALATYPGALLWGTDAVGALCGTLDAIPFDDNEPVQLVHHQSRHSAPSIRWTRRRVPSEHRVRIGALRAPSARYLAVEAAARDSGALIERFLRDGRIKPSELADVLPALAGSAGPARRRRVVRVSGDNPWSGGERELLALLRRHPVTRWVANAELVVDQVRCFPDVLFEHARLVVEFDGYAVHAKPEVFEADRRRQNRLVLAGYRVLRYTWKQLTETPEALIAELRAALACEIASDSHPG